jgi:hypothetical protein
MLQLATLLAQETTTKTPDTLNYMIYGYIFGLGILFLLVFSIWWRYRNLAADEAALQKLESEIEKEKTTTKNAAEAI